MNAGAWAGLSKTAVVRIRLGGFWVWFYIRWLEGVGSLIGVVGMGYPVLSGWGRTGNGGFTRELSAKTRQGRERVYIPYLRIEMWGTRLVGLLEG
jgi:hypothetical protein